MIDSSTGEANTHMYWTGFTLITCKNSIAGPIVNTQSVVVLVWIILGVSIKPGLCYDIPESLYGRTGIPYREHRTAVYRYISISLHPYSRYRSMHTKNVCCYTWRVQKYEKEIKHIGPQFQNAVGNLIHIHCIFCFHFRR